MAETRNSVTWATIKWTTLSTILWTWASRTVWIWENRIGHAKFEDPVPRSPRTNCTNSRRRSGTLSIQMCSPGKSSRCDWICPRLGCRWVRLKRIYHTFSFSNYYYRLYEFSYLLEQRRKCKNVKEIRHRLIHVFVRSKEIGMKYSKYDCKITFVIVVIKYLWRFLSNKYCDISVVRESKRRDTCRYSNFLTVLTKIRQNCGRSWTRLKLSS